MLPVVASSRPSRLASIVFVFLVLTVGAPGQVFAAVADHAGVVRLMLGGDLLLDLGVAIALDEEGPGPVLGAWGQIMTACGADLGFANLESPVSDLGQPLTDKAYTFRAPPETAAQLQPSGFHVVSLANNHALDFGPEALRDTLARLEQSGVIAVGAGRDRGEAYRPSLVQVGSAQVVCLAFTDTFAVPLQYRAMWEAGADRAGTALLVDHTVVVNAVREARQLADRGGRSAAPTRGLVLVSFHWGYEYLRRPAATDRRLAHKAIDAGADLVVGHHPHVTQGIEVYRGRLILYSLGNLLFDSDRSPDRTVAALVTVERDPVARGWATTDCRVVPFAMDRTHLELPEAGDAQARRLLEEIAELSAELGTRSHLEPEAVLDGKEVLVLDHLPKVSLPHWAGWQPR